MTVSSRSASRSEVEVSASRRRRRLFTVIDEIGYLPIDRQGANLFFQLVSRRYERGAILRTSNQSLGA